MQDHRDVSIITPMTAYYKEKLACSRDDDLLQGETGLQSSLGMLTDTFHEIIVEDNECALHKGKVSADLIITYFGLNST